MMKSMSSILYRMKMEWETPQWGSDDPNQDGFRMACQLFERTDDFSNPFDFELPAHLSQLWTQIQDARLFVDVDYGQWGLELLSENESLETSKEALSERPRDFKQSDIVIGRFIGDSDLLVVSAEQGDDFGSVLVALPLDGRSDWYFVSNNLLEFLESYLAYQGNKFWE